MRFKEVLFFFLEIIQIVVIALIIVVPIRYFIFQPFLVKGASMEDNFSNGDYLVVDELTYRLRDPQRGEVVVFRYPKDESQRFIKRIVGLPGETVKLEESQVIIIDSSGNSYVLDESGYLASANWSGDGEFVLLRDEYFVLGDNRPHSFDSRRWGALKREDIIGRAIIRAWPFDAMTLIGAPSY